MDQESIIRYPSSTINYDKRARGEEYLDDPDVNGADLEQNLRELRFINHTLGGNNVTTSGLREVLNKNPKNHWSIADIGCGGGDILQLIAKEMKRKKVSFALTGVDMNEHILRYAQEHTPHIREVRYLKQNVLSSEFDASQFDIVNATLFCHHFSDEDLVVLFSKLRKEVKVAVILNDLHRHFLAYHSIKILTRLFSKSFMVKHDAPLSVLRGFSRKELMALFARSGFTNVEVKWCWAFRWKCILYV